MLVPGARQPPEPQFPPPTRQESIPLNRERIARSHHASAFARALAWAGAALLLLAVAAAPARSQGYPRLGLYGHVDGRGFPLVLPGGELNYPMIDDVSRYNTI